MSETQHPRRPALIPFPIPTSRPPKRSPRRWSARPKSSPKAEFALHQAPPAGIRGNRRYPRLHRCLRNSGPPRREGHPRLLRSRSIEQLTLCSTLASSTASRAKTHSLPAAAPTTPAKANARSSSLAKNAVPSRGRWPHIFDQIGEAAKSANFTPRIKFVEVQGLCPRCAGGEG